MVRGLRRVGLALVAVLAVACASPTLPLPPPAEPSIAAIPGDTTRVHLSSKFGAEAGAIIVILNQNPTVPLDKRVTGSQADGSGSWDADVVATHGDYLEITQEFQATRSPPIEVQVP